ncbi:ABC transporter ATP-binding protein [Phytohabitans flavus]|uniref:ABC transporter ATP-binding protein n=1 Tax=Phytohabitans flavus TaxID=1076124 RepID=A0A6F8Y790_9ACTN|nr:ABC transporter ATP-binding protein [Phytohabitans flavus]BCB81848.1 ABC transporter ATP-binding protein [Phytohabitans flavus]
MADILITEALTRRYGSLVAVDRIDLRIAPGERRAIIGPNGAGKTTLLDLVAGAIRPSGGRIRFDGRDITGSGPARRARLGIGRIHQRPAVWPSLTTLDNVAVAAAQSRGGVRRSRRPAIELLDRLGLADQAGVEAARLSHGQRRQLEIAMALAGEPRLLLLDEPAAGLSAVEFERLGEVLRDLPEGMTVLLVEHRLDLVYAFADVVTVLRDGQYVVSGTPDEIRMSHTVRQAYSGAVA